MGKETSSSAVAAAAYGGAGQPLQPSASSIINNDYIQTRTEGDLIIMDIGKSLEIEAIYQRANQRVVDVEKNFDAQMRNILTQLQTMVINKNGTALDGFPPATPMIAATPSKKTKTTKRKAPLSSSVKKVVIHKGQRKRSKNSNSSNNSSAGGRKLFGKSTESAPSASGAALNYEETTERLAGYMDLMTEMSIPANSSTTSAGPSQAQPYIADEATIVVNNKPNIVDESNSSISSAGRVTRSKTKAATSTVTKLQPPPSVGKSTRSKKAKAAVDETTGPAGSSASAASLNTTPSKRNQVSVSGSASKARSKATSALPSYAAHNVTPQKTARLAAGATSPSSVGTPNSTLRRIEKERERKEKLMASADKRRKADENKRLQLEAKTIKIREDREKRLEKLKNNQAALQAQKAAIKPESQAIVVEPKPMTAAQKRAAERRERMAAVMAAAANEPQKKTRGAAKKVASSVADEDSGTSTESVAKGGSKNSSSKVKSEGKKEKAAPKKGSKKKDATASASTSATSQGHLSPISKPSINTEGLNGRLDTTFTQTDAAPISAQSALTPGPSTMSAPPVHSTFADGQDASVTFAMPAVPPPSTPNRALNGTFNMAKKALGTSGANTSGYQMTPPPKPSPFEEDYDISRYIDSDDEEQQDAAATESQGKKIPSWATGKAFLNMLHAQFRKTEEETAEQVKRIFGNGPVLPVPLDTMGLPVRERYAVRSSSVNWNKAEEILASLERP